MRLRMFAFPFGGGGAHSFAPLGKRLRHIELETFEYPGRGRRIGESLCTDASALAADALETLRPRLTPPYALFGHSLGAHVVALLLRAIEERDLPRPLIGVVSGASSPTTRSADGDHLLPDADFIEVVRAMGGTPDEVLSSPELVQMFLPILRADFQAVASYEWPAGSKVQTPLLYLVGQDDTDISPADRAAWAQLTTGGCEVREAPGGHFFVIEESAGRVAALLDEIGLRAVAS